jgi:hypothetical protein
VKSKATRRFWDAFKQLPRPVQEQARIAYAQFQTNPAHPSLRFKVVHPGRAVYSARISRGFRALGVRQGEELVWFWIGGHDDYERLLKNL